MSPGNPFILGSKRQRSRSRVTKLVTAWVFAVFWALASCIVRVCCYLCGSSWAPGWRQPGDDRRSTRPARRRSWTASRWDEPVAWRESFSTWTGRSHGALRRRSRTPGYSPSPCQYYLLVFSVATVLGSCLIAHRIRLVCCSFKTASAVALL